MTERARERLRFRRCYEVMMLSQGISYPLMGMDNASGEFKIVVPGGNLERRLLRLGYSPFCRFFGGREQKIEGL